MGNLNHVRLSEKDKIQGRSDRYIFNEQQSNYNNINHIIDIIRKQIENYGIKDDDVIVVHVRKQTNVFLLLNIINYALLNKYQCMFEIEDNNREYNCPLLPSFNENLHQKYKQRIDVYLDNSKIRKKDDN